MRRVVVVVVVVCLTCTEQSGTSIGDAVKREITQGLVEGHGVEKGIAVAGACAFYDLDGVVITGKRFDFETCEEIIFSSQTVVYTRVGCMCVAFDVCRV